MIYTHVLAVDASRALWNAANITLNASRVELGPFTVAFNASPKLLDA
jgi:hypothetical protein